MKEILIAKHPKFLHNILFEVDWVCTLILVKWQKITTQFLVHMYENTFMTNIHSMWTFFLYKYRIQELKVCVKYFLSYPQKNLSPEKGFLKGMRKYILHKLRALKISHRCRHKNLAFTNYHFLRYAIYQLLAW